MSKRNPQETKANILQAAIEEFARVGFGGARIDHIAKLSGANKRMIYHYFGNKDELYLAVLEHMYADIRSHESKLQWTEQAPDEAIRSLISYTFNYFIDKPQFINLLNNENLHKAEHVLRSDKIKRMHSPLLQSIDETLQRGVEAGLFRAGVDAMQLYVSIASLGYFYLSNAHTLGAIFERDLLSEAALEQRHEHISEVILSYLRKT